MGFFDNISVNTGSEEEHIIDAMFPSKNPARRLQMVTRTQPRAIQPMSVLGVFRRLFSSRVLQWWQEEMRYNEIARNGEGRIELAEVMASVRRQLPNPNED